MSSLRLSYASSPESDLEHSPGPPMSMNTAGISSGTNHNGMDSVGLASTQPPPVGRLTKASSDPSVVMAVENSSIEQLPPYQV